MESDNRSREVLLNENEELRFRLEEAEETLQAIRSGAVDALVVTAPEGEQVFTLQGADHAYRILVESMSEGAAILAPDGTILYCNKRLADMLQVPLEKLIGSRLRSYVSSTYCRLFTSRLEKCALEQEKDEITLVSGTGKRIPVLFSCSTVVASGVPTVSVVLTDISARKLAEEKILHLNRLYAVQSGTSKAIVHAVNRESLFREICRLAVELGGFKSAWIGLMDDNSGTVRLVAWSGPEEPNPDNIQFPAGEFRKEASFAGNADRDADFPLTDDIIGRPYFSQWREGGENGDNRSLASIPLNLYGRIIGRLTLYSGETEFFHSEFANLLQQMGMDISFALDKFDQEARRKETEEALRQETTERLRTLEELHEKERLLILQSRQAAMGEMINNIAHQWRQPLNSLSLGIQCMTELYHDGNLDGHIMDEISHKLIALIMHMSQTIDDFRNFFRPDMEMRPFNLNEKIRKTLALVGDRLKAQNISVEFEMEENLVTTGYSNEYCQVLMNILNNAVDVFEERNISSPYIRIRTFRDGMRTVTTISDNAGGIPDEIIDKIFDPYFTTKDAVKGTGIGLYMSKAIIEERMNGKISVRNTGQGAEFSIEV